MINFINEISEKPYILFREKYYAALRKKQPSIEAISISSYSLDNSEVDSRFVNLKYLDGKKFIFFTNYDSPKSFQFKSHNQIAVNIYWQKINLQIRIKAHIRKTTKKYNSQYFSKRSLDKNALAISSSQSQPINSYEEVRTNYQNVLKNMNLVDCPKYWGGFSFIPYYFEFWEGHDSRLNKREVFNKIDGIWKHSFLQP
jgi:pyridoxamine 5'-phosphate oxidase